MKLLVIEDEKKIADSLKKGLEQEYFSVDVLYHGEEGYDLASSEDYDAIILDVMLPGKSGFEISRELRDLGINTPILMLTARSETEDKIRGLSCGADDYLAKPFSFEELLARIRALLRRPPIIKDSIMTYGNILINRDKHEVKIDGKSIELSKKEYLLLEYLLNHEGKYVSKDKIISDVWEFEDNVLPNTVEVYIGYLRKKIGRNKILTSRGFGYKIID